MTPSPAAGGAEGLRNDSKGGGGSGGQRKPPEKPVPEAEDEDSKLDADSFAGRRAKDNLDQLFADKLPWEMDEDEKLRRLEEMHQRKVQGTGRSLPGRPGTAPLKPSTAPLEPPPAMLPTVKGRQVDGNFDNAAGINSTLSAWQSMRQRQVQADEEKTAPPPAQPRGPLTGPLLGRAPLPPRPAPLPPRPELPLANVDVPIEQAPRQPLQVPRPLPPRVRTPLGDAPIPGTGELPPRALPGQRSPSGQLVPPPAPPVTETPPKLPGTGRLGPLPPVAPAQPEPRPSIADLRARPAEPRQAPLDLRPATAELRIPAAESSVPPRVPRPPIAPLTEPAPAQRPPARGTGPLSLRDGTTPPYQNAPPAAAPKPAAPPAAPRPSWLANPDQPTTIAEGASATGMPAVRATGTSGAFAYRVIDATSGDPLVGARLELEPVEDDMLPVYNGTADGLGWWGESNVPPGAYRVSVRSPGFVPAFQPRDMVAGRTDDLVIYMTRP